MTKYVCNRCNYRFESEGEYLGKRCPYCHEKALIKQPSAQNLLDE